MVNPFFKNIYDSGLTEKWFSLVGNSLITAAALIVWREGSAISGVIAFISYIFLATQSTHGTRESHEYLKNIYVYPQVNKWKKFSFYFIFRVFRGAIIAFPLLLVWWAYMEGRLLF